MEGEIAARRGVSSFALKVVAAVTMLIDHIGASLVEWSMRYLSDPATREVLRAADGVLRIVGRAAFPIFIFLIVEGFFRTSDRKRYLGRIALFALLSELPFDLALFCSREPIQALTLWHLSFQNVMLTHLIGLAALCAIDALRPRDENAGQAASAARIVACAGVAVAACWLAELLSTDYSWNGVLAIILAYLGRLVGGVQLQAVGALAPLMIMAGVEPFAIASLPLLLLYNGEKGRSLGRWFFYAFYPAHLLVLGIIKVAILLPM